MTFKNSVKTLSTRIMDFILPPLCPLCKTGVDHKGGFCAACWNSLNFITDPYCESCGIPFEFEVVKHMDCAECTTKPPPFKRARSVFTYNDAIKKLILGLKYNDQTHLAALFAGQLLKVGGPMLKRSHLIVPVPLHPKRLFSRRFNQAAMIVSAMEKLSPSSDKSCFDLLKRIRHTDPQGTLSRPQREKNLKKAFILNPKYEGKLKGKVITLIDDVFTTGATLKECSKVLKRAGAKEINVLTIARVVF